MDVIILLVSLVVGLVVIVVSVIIANYLHESADARFEFKKGKYRLKRDIKEFEYLIEKLKASECNIQHLEQQLQALKDK